MTTSVVQLLIKHRQRRTTTAPNPIVEAAPTVTNERKRDVEEEIVPATNVLDLEVVAEVRRKLVRKGKEITTITMVIKNNVEKVRRIHLQRRGARKHHVVSKTHLPSGVERIERRKNAVVKVLVIRIITIETTNRIMPRIAMKIRNKWTMNESHDSKSNAKRKRQRNDMKGDTNA